MADAEKTPSTAALVAQRQAFMMLEEYYDDANKRYKPGYDDAKISTETGLNIKAVQQIREAAYGPLGEPQELVDLRADVATFQTELSEQRESNESKLRVLTQRLDRIVMKNGWRE